MRSESGYFSVQSKAVTKVEDTQPTIKESVNEVVFSEGLKRSLELGDAHNEYFRLLKCYQKAICLMSEDTLSKFT